MIHKRQAGQSQAAIQCFYIDINELEIWTRYQGSAVKRRDDVVFGCACEVLPGDVLDLELPHMKSISKVINPMVLVSQGSLTVDVSHTDGSPP